MKVLKVFAAGAVAALMLTGCASLPEESQVVEQRSCAVIESRNWEAWLNTMPGPGSTATLHVQGEIVLPTPGFDARLSAGRADRSATPSQQLNLDLTPPSGIVSQVQTTEQVSYQGPAIAAQYANVRVMCGGRMIAEITQVRNVQ